MSVNSNDLINTRIEKVSEKLLETDGAYALAVNTCKRLYANIEPIIAHDRQITICQGDIQDFSEFFDQEALHNKILQKELYKQGYLDCVNLLQFLGVLR